MPDPHPAGSPPPLPGESPFALSPATRQVVVEGPFRLRAGGALPRVVVAYETWGRPAAGGDNTVLLLTGLSPSAHAASSEADPAPGWWEAMVGPGRPLDTRRWHVVCVNHLGSCFGSTGPASPNPSTGRPYRLDFPELRVEDLARAAREALRALGLRPRVVLGASLGGMAALAYALQFPEELEGLGLISAAARATPFAIALRSLQRELVRADPAWRGGAYPLGRQPVTGLRLARKLGLISYRSAEEWQRRFGRERLPHPPQEPFGPQFQVEAYMERNARRFAKAFDANCYLYLSRAMDLFDAAEHGEGSVEQALARVRARRCLVAGVRTDFLFPLHQQEELAEGLREGGTPVRFAALDSVQGHDAFLVDEARFGPLLRAFLEELA